jgi:hypothetical protein
MKLRCKITMAFSNLRFRKVEKRIVQLHIRRLLVPGRLT